MGQLQRVAAGGEGRDDHAHELSARIEDGTSGFSSSRGHAKHHGIGIAVFAIAYDPAEMHRFDGADPGRVSLGMGFAEREDGFSLLQAGSGGRSHRRHLQGRDADEAQVVVGFGRDDAAIVDPAVGGPGANDVSGAGGDVCGRDDMALAVDDETGPR